MAGCSTEHTQLDTWKRKQGLGRITLYLAQQGVLVASCAMDVQIDHVCPYRETAIAGAQRGLHLRHLLHAICKVQTGRTGVRNGHRGAKGWDYCFAAIHQSKHARKQHKRQAGSPTRQGSEGCDFCPIHVTWPRRLARPTTTDIEVFMKPSVQWHWFRSSLFRIVSNDRHGA